MNIINKLTQTGRSETVLCFSLRPPAVRPVVARRGVDAGVSSNLLAPPTAHRAVRPHRPRGPATVHYTTGRNGSELIHQHREGLRGKSPAADHTALRAIQRLDRLIDLLCLQNKHGD